MFLLTLTSLMAADLQLSEPGWNFGTITFRDKVLERDLVVTNSEKKTAKVSIIPTCDCLTVTPSEQNISPGGNALFRLFYNPHEDSGVVERFYMIDSDLPGFESVTFKVNGYVDVGVSSSETGDTVPEGDVVKIIQPGNDFVLTVLYYYMSTCPTCRKFITTGFPELIKKLNVSVELVKRTVDKPEIFKEYQARLAMLGAKQKAIPVMIIGDKVLQGNEAIDRNIEKEILYGIKHKVVTDVNPDIDTSDIELKRNLTFLPVFLAGLIDGINPCAFATIIMLITSLALAGKRRKEILVIGTFFTISVFVTYYAVGVGIFTAIQAASTFPIIAQILRWVLFSLLIVCAALSIYDYFKIKAGKSNEMILQLSDVFKNKIRNSIRLHVRSAALILSSLSLGFLVSIFELGCTGQIYLPTILTMVRVGKDFWGFIFLFIYCIGFIIPLVLVFALTYRGISSQKVVKIFQERMSTVKLVLAVLFLGLAVLTLVLY